MNAATARAPRRFFTPKGPVETNVAFCAPFVLFALLFGGVWLADMFFAESEHLLLREPEYLIFPLQTVVVGLALLYYRHSYPLPRLTPSHWFLGLGSAVLVFVIWMAPLYFFNAAPRLEGYNPDVFAENPLLYTFQLGMRFLRLVIVVPYMEEIFWRGWLQRQLVEEDVDEVPIGKFTWISYLGVAFCFGLAHLPHDFWPAVVTGLVWNALIVKTRSLSCLILSHAVINLTLGLWIMWSRQWGYW